MAASSEASLRMVDDLGRHTAAQMQDVLNRNMAVAQSVLPPPELMIMLLNIANGVAIGAALFAMQVSKDDADPEALWQMTADALPKLFLAGKPIVLAEFAKRGRAGAPEHG